MARAYSHPVTAPAPLRMSYDEWQAWYGAGELNRGEWVNGEVVLFMPPLTDHVFIVSFLSRLVGNFSDFYDLGDVATDQLELWLPHPHSQAARLPDICFISHDHTDRLSTHRLEGYADLVVEVISKDSVTRDRRRKFAEYQTAGIPEYWIVDPRPRHQTVDFYTLDDTGHYQAAVPDAEGRLRSGVLPGFWLDPAWLWRDPPPGPYHLIAQIIAERPAPLP